MANFLKNFTINAVVGKTSPDVLSLFLADRRIDPPFDLAEEHKTRGKADYTRDVSNWLLSIIDQHPHILRDLHTVHIMAPAKALENFIQTNADKMAAGVTEGASVYRTDYDIALWYVIREQALCLNWRRVYTITHADARQWKSRGDYAPADGQFISDEMIEALKSAVTDHFAATLKSGPSRVEAFTHGTWQCIFLTTADYPQTQDHWIDQDLKHSVIIPPHLVAVMYEPATRHIQVHARSSNTRNDLHAICAETLFERPLPERERPTFHKDEILGNLLKYRRTTVKIPQGSPIQDMWVYGMEFSVGNPKLKAKVGISVEPDASLRSPTGDDPLLDLFSRHVWFKTEEYMEKGRGIARLTSIKMVATYRERPDSELQTRTFSIYGKNTSRLGATAVDIAILDVLRANGMAHIPGAEHNTAKAA